MRYPEDDPRVFVESASQVEPSWVFATAIYGAILGVGFVVVGLRVRQYWLAIWGASLTIASLAYLGWAVFTG